MRILCSGGCGFIGSHIVDRLVEDHEVIVIDNLSATETHDQFYFNDKAKYYHDDICDYVKIEELFRGVDVVFHLAARSRIQVSMQNPFLTAQTNFNGTLNVLEASKVHKVKRVIFSSTSAAYGKNNPPQKEEMQPDCLNQYSASKVGAENLCKAYTNLYNLETVIFRYFNVYGPREPKKGPYAPIVGLFQRQLANGEMLTIVGDGLQTRDFTHVSDVVEANILAMDLANNRPVGEIINIGAGVSSTIVGIADALDTRSEQIYEYLPPRPGEARHTRASISKAKRLLRWKPKVNFKKYLDEIRIACD